MSTAAPIKPTTAASSATRRRVAVVHEPGQSGAAALDLARELDLQQGASVTVVAVAPSAPSGPRCGGSALDFNAAVRDVVADELEQARTRLGHAAGRTSYVLLVEGKDPPLEEWMAARRFDVILLPARRRLLRTPGHPAAARLRGSTDSEVRIVQRRSG
jgi:nucleotide-binding universal stress UspA family protein